MSTTPAITAGVVDTTRNDSFSDWKLAASSRKITTTASSKPGAQAVQHLRQRHDLAAHRDVHARRRRPKLLRAPARPACATLPRSAPAMLAVTVTMRCML